MLSALGSPGALGGCSEELASFPLPPPRLAGPPGPLLPWVGLGSFSGRVYLHRGNCPKWPLWRSWQRGRGCAPRSSSCPEAEPRARPTSCLGLSRPLPHAQPASPGSVHRRLRELTLDERAMSPGRRACEDERNGDPAGGGGGPVSPATGARAWAVSALCLLLSASSAVACLLLGVQAAALQGRVAALEEERELLWRAGTPDALAAWAEPRLERLLREVRRGVGSGECLCAGSRGSGEGSPASDERPSASRQAARGGVGGGGGWGAGGRAIGPTVPAAASGSACGKNKLRRTVSGTSRGRKRKDRGL